MSVEANKTLIRRQIERWTEYNSAILDDLYAACVEWHEIDMLLSGIDAVKQRYFDERDIYSYRHFDIEELIGEGDKVVVRLLFYGTRATGEREVKTGIQIYRVDNGKIQEMWQVWQDGEAL